VIEDDDADDADDVSDRLYQYVTNVDMYNCVWFCLMQT